MGAHAPTGRRRLAIITNGNPRMAYTHTGNGPSAPESATVAVLKRQLPLATVRCLHDGCVAFALRDTTLKLVERLTLGRKVLGAMGA